MIKAASFLAVFASIAMAAGAVTMPPSPSPTHQSFALSLPPETATSGREPAAPRPAGQSAMRGEDGLFYVHAKVNGRPVRFMIDTGSNIVVLAPRDAALVGSRRSGVDEGTMQTAGGMARVHNATIDRLVIAGQTLDDVDAVAVDAGLSVSLLGQSALSRLGSIRLSGDRIDLN